MGSHSPAFLRLLGGFSAVTAVNAAIGLFVSATLANRMGVEGYGVYVYWTSLILALMNVMPLGIGMAVVIFRYKMNEEAYSRMLRDSLLVVLPLTLVFLGGVGIVLSLVEVIVLRPVEALLAVGVVFLQSSIVIACLFSQASHKIKLFAAFSLPLYSGSYIVSVLAYEAFESIPRMYGAVALYLVVIYAFAFRYLARKLQFSYEGLSLFEVVKGFRERAHICMPAMASSSLMSFMVVGDKLILARIGHASELGVYAAASTLAAVPLFLINNLASSWGAYISRHLSGKSNEEVRSHIRRAARWVLVAPLVLAPVALVQYVILHILFAEQYAHAYSVVLIIDCALLLYGASKIFIGYLNYFERQVVTLYAVVVSAASLILTAPTFHASFGMHGVALSVVFTMAIFLLLEAGICGYLARSFVLAGHK